jgi:hypothetical protein
VLVGVLVVCSGNMAVPQILIVGRNSYCEPPLKFRPTVSALGEVSKLWLSNVAVNLELISTTRLRGPSIIGAYI